MIVGDLQEAVGTLGWSDFASKGKVFTGGTKVPCRRSDEIEIPE